MRVLADIPIWSAVLRRSEKQHSLYRREMEKLLAEGIVEMIGPIRQELLSGIRDFMQFEFVRDQLRIFPDLEITTEDFEVAASYFNRCRSKGIQGSSTDYLLCAVAIRHDLQIFTDDKDFLGYQKILPIQFYPVSWQG